MSNQFSEYLAGYLKRQSDNYKEYLLTALNNKDHSITLLASSGGVNNDSKDLRNLELLSDAQIFQETLQFSRSGRNAYKIFSLTNMGLKMAEDLKNQNAVAVHS
jgi:hypothetical protein